MKKLVAILTLVVSITFAPAQVSASTPGSALAGAKKTSEPATQTQLFKAAPANASLNGSPNKDHTFQVNDVKGLLLTCIAPQVETNPDTDLFNSCTLAPGRTLDDVMHTFIQAIHFELDQHQKERDEWNKDLEERLAQKPAQK
jgi:hypothetical protein